MDVRSLAYLGIAVPDVDEWHRFATDVLGVPGERGDDGVLRLRLDERNHRVALRTDATTSLDYVGFDVADDWALDEATKQLESAGITVTHGTQEEADVRKVQRLVSFLDPNDYRVELSHGQLWEVDRPVQPTRPLHGLRGLGHVVLGAPALSETIEFYVRVLGFRLTDYRSKSLYFLRCNDRHHSIAFASTDRQMLHHFFIDVATIDDVGWTYDVARSAGHEITAELGRHANDLAISFYLRVPGGFQVEYGTGGLQVDEATWVAHEFTVGDLWGHQRPTGDAITIAPATTK